MTRVCFVVATAAAVSGADLPDGQARRLARSSVERPLSVWRRRRLEPGPMGPGSAAHHGDMADFPEMMTWPKPVEKPYPPILVGGGFPQAARRAIRYGDGLVLGRPHRFEPA